MTEKSDDNRPLEPEERRLGMDTEITRRDFINQVAAGAGAALIGAAGTGHAQPPAAAPAAAGEPWHPWTGYAGVGDYARSNGNTWEVVSAGHGIRDALYGASPQAHDTGEIYDVVIVGGGFAGVIAAYEYQRQTNRRGSCLILEDHPLMGGEGKRNEFM